MSALTRAAAALHRGVGSIALLATGALLVVPAGAGAALVPHFTALPASSNTQLSVARDGVAMAPLPGGRALVVGGLDSSAVRTTADIFDSATDTFTPAPTQLGTPRSGAAVAPLPGGKVLIAGGSTTGFAPVRTAEVFDPGTGTFTALPASGNTELSVARAAAAAAPLPDGRVLIAGGADNAPLQSAELFDPASNTFTALPAAGATQLQTARDNFIAVPLPGGKVLIAGGSGVSGVLASAEIFDPATETFSALPASGATQLQTARTAPAAAALPDGRVLIAGGDSSSGTMVSSADVLSSAEVFDPASDTFTALPPAGTTQLQNARAYTAATSLSNGRVLFAGGAGPGYLASAELATLPPSCSTAAASVAAGAPGVQVALHCSGFSLAYSIAGNPSHGSLSAINQSTGTLTYTPNAGFAGPDSFTYLATNVAGPSEVATVNISVPTPPPGPPSISLGSASVLGTRASLPITCQGAPGATCTGRATFSTRVSTLGSTPVRVARPAAAKRKPTTKTVTVATSRFSVPAGRRGTVRVTLNAVGKRLLARFYEVPTRMRIIGTSSRTKAITFSYRRLHLAPAYQWTFSKTYAFPTQLTVSGLPRKSHVALVCQGGGCPFPVRAFAAPKRGALELAPVLQRRHLAVGATVDVQITAANTVGEVVRFTVLSDRVPRESFLCLPPGARRPMACA